MAVASVKNITEGPKVFNSAPPVVILPGEVLVGPFVISADDLAMAELSEWFEFTRQEQAKRPVKQG